MECRGNSHDRRIRALSLCPDQVNEAEALEVRLLAVSSGTAGSTESAAVLG